MKKKFQTLLILCLTILTIFSCQNENSTKTLQISHENNLSKKLIEVSVKDSLKLSMGSISKSYGIEMNGSTVEDKNISVNKNWKLDFTFINLNDKSFFVPHSVFPIGKIDHPLKMEIKEDYSIDLIRQTDKKFYFEIEICYAFIPAKKEKNTYPEGITLTEGNNLFARDIFEGLSKDDGNERLKIKQRMQKTENDLCRKIKVQQEGTMVVFSDVDVQNMDELRSSLISKLSIIESGNLLDTLKIEKSIWSDYRRQYK